MSPRDSIRLVCRLAIWASLGTGAYWAVRLSWADCLFRQGSEKAVRQAVGIVPWCAEYHMRMATILESEGRPGAEAELREATKANQRLSGAWVDLGLKAENAGNLAHAEQCLRRALWADRTYSILWIVANFYFRHGVREKFWPIARQALTIGDVTAYDPAPLFGLCWNLAPDAGVILEQAIPESGPVEARYLQFLLRGNLVSATEQVAERVLALSGEPDLGAVFDYCDRLIAEGDSDRAIHAWNALCWRTLRGYRRLDPDAGVSLTNADFAAEPVGRGFDWRLPSVDGITLERGGQPPRLWVTFDGRQPESCGLAEQVVALVPGRAYRLRFRYQTDGLATPSGVRWRVMDSTGRSEITSSSTDLSSELETPGNMRFRAPKESRLARLVLVYRRVPGTVRIEGRVSVSDMALEWDR